MSDQRLVWTIHGRRTRLRWPSGRGANRELRIAFEDLGPVNETAAVLAGRGAAVLVTLPAGGTVPGTVTRVGRDATEPPGQPGGRPTVPVTIALTLPPAAGDLDQAPVRVAMTAAERKGVLRVPVTALLAKAGGGYQVRVPGGQLIDVLPGLYDDAAGTIEVTGAGLAEGMRVEVPVP